jgi:uncharacterized BrkB/YihY/UPF0761 family membrane protein
MNSNIKPEKYRGLSIAALVTGILGLSQLFIQLGPIMKKFIPSSLIGNVGVLIFSIVLNFIVFGLPIAAIVCGSIDLKKIQAGRYSNKGRGFDIAGIVLGGIFIFVGIYIAVGEEILSRL